MIFDSIEGVYEQWRKYDNESHKTLVTVATTVGFLFIILKLLIWFYEIIVGLRLYVFSQLSCCKTNYIKRYGKWVIISGSTSGIGLGMAKEFARRGHSILVLANRGLEEAKIILEQEPNVGEIETIEIDMFDSSIENYQRLRKQIDPDRRDIGILINNAGVMSQKLERYNEHSLESIRSIINVNVMGVALLTRIILPSMVENGKGLVVNVSSMAGCLSSPYMSVYGPSKSFIDYFSKVIHDEYSSLIDVINLTPGGVQTNIYNEVSSDDFGVLLKILPQPKYYAKRAVNAMSTRYCSYSGTLVHGLGLELCKSLTQIGFQLFKYSIKGLMPIKKLPPKAVIVHA